MHHTPPIWDNDKYSVVPSFQLDPFIAGGSEVVGHGFGWSSSRTLSCGTTEYLANTIGSLDQMFEDNSHGYGVAGRSLGENNLFTLSFWPPIQGFDKISLSTDFSADESSFPSHQELFEDFVEV